MRPDARGWSRPCGATDGSTCSSTTRASAAARTRSTSTSRARARVLEVNFLAQIGLTRALWGRLVETRGGVINVSSGLGTFVRSDSAAYAASKHALTAWSRVLRIQGLRQGVQVLTLNPGPVTTAQFTHEVMAATRLGRYLLIDPARCADDALRGFDRGRAEVWSHPAYRFVAAAQSLAPGLFARHFS